MFLNTMYARFFGGKHPYQVKEKPSAGDEVLDTALELHLTSRREEQERE